MAIFPIWYWKPGRQAVNSLKRKRITEKENNTRQVSAGYCVGAGHICYACQELSEWFLLSGMVTNVYRKEDLNLYSFRVPRKIYPLCAARLFPKRS